MPLSDHEEQILQEIERQLYEHDPKFARGVAEKSLHALAARNVRRGVALFLLGFAVLVLFFIQPAVPVGVAAFLLMLAGAIHAYRNARKAGAEQTKVGVPLSRMVGRLKRGIPRLRKRDES